ncbi:MAG: hypothetical protein J0M04_10915 [Verrucomicrobia bacterium]|nr:hypothetical protein [Verrucomicrobiota bacterium]
MNAATIEIQVQWVLLFRGALLTCIRRLLPPQPTVKMMPLDLIKIAYSDQTPKRLNLLVALVPVKPKIERIRYGCDRMSEVGRIIRGRQNRKRLET